MITDIINDALHTVVPHPQIIVLLLLTFWIGGHLLRFFTSPLRKQGIPGPLLGQITSWYRAYYALIGRNWHKKLQQLHAQHGSVVWIAPDEISVSDPNLRSTIYGFADERKEQSFFPKAKSFETGQINEDFNFVFETDPKKARLGKYAISHAYSEKGLSILEPEFDKVGISMNTDNMIGRDLAKQLWYLVLCRIVANSYLQAVEDLVSGLSEHHSQRMKPCNFGKWGHYFMYDLSSRLCCGYTSGLCKAGTDKDDQIHSVRVIFEVIGALVPVNFTLKITTPYIRKALLNSYLEKFFQGCLLNDEYYSKEVGIPDSSMHGV